MSKALVQFFRVKQGAVKEGFQASKLGERPAESGDLRQARRDLHLGHHVREVRASLRFLRAKTRQERLSLGSATFQCDSCGMAVSERLWTLRLSARSRASASTGVWTRDKE